jgi:hypothetical protein
MRSIDVVALLRGELLSSIHVVGVVRQLIELPVVGHDPAS